MEKENSVDLYINSKGCVSFDSYFLRTFSKQNNVKCFTRAQINFSKCPPVALLYHDFGEITVELGSIVIDGKIKIL